MAIFEVLSWNLPGTTVEDHIKRVVTPNLQVLTQNLSTVLYGCSFEKTFGYLWTLVCSLYTYKLHHFKQMQHFTTSPNLKIFVTKFILSIPLCYTDIYRKSVPSTQLFEGVISFISFIRTTAQCIHYSWCLFFIQFDVFIYFSFNIMSLFFKSQSPFIHMFILLFSMSKPTLQWT